MLRPQSDRSIEILLHRREGLPRSGRHHIEAHRKACPGEHRRCPPHVFWRVVAVERAKRRRIERLAAEAHAGHTTVGGRRKQLRRHIQRVGFEGHFGSGSQQQPFSQHDKQPPQPVWPEVGGRAAAEVEGVDLERLPNPPQLEAEGLEIAVDQVIAARHEREIAVATAVATEGHMHIDRPRQAHSHTRSRPSSMSGSRLDTMRWIRSSV